MSIDETNVIGSLIRNNTFSSSSLVQISSFELF